MASLAKSVSATRRYARFFGYPLDQNGLHRWLISEKVVNRQALVRFRTQASQAENSTVKSLNHVYERKIKLAQKAASFLALFPTVSLVCLTGSLAMKNAKPNDDIDLMVVTRESSLWLTRLFLVPLLGLFFKRRLPSDRQQVSNAICLNLWLDETALAVPPKKRNLYTAHEVLQALPLFDRGGVYRQFILANAWTKKYLANAYRIALEKDGCSNVFFEKLSQSRNAWTGFAGFRGENVDSRRPQESTNYRSGEKYVANPIISLVNKLAFKLQYSYMKKKITNETITLHSAYFHPRDLSGDIDKYLKDR